MILDIISERVQVDSEEYKVREVRIHPVIRDLAVIENVTTIQREHIDYEYKMSFKHRLVYALFKLAMGVYRFGIAESWVIAGVPVIIDDHVDDITLVEDRSE